MSHLKLGDFFLLFLFLRIKIPTFFLVFFFFGKGVLPIIKTSRIHMQLDERLLNEIFLFSLGHFVSNQQGHHPVVKDFCSLLVRPAPAYFSYFPCNPEHSGRPPLVLCTDVPKSTSSALA